MGTNFYLRRIPTEKEHQEMQEKLMQKQYEELQELISEYTVVYHIGKRSGGWQFLFEPHKDNYHQNPWDNTLESLKKCLSDPNYEIFNEYGEKFTSEQFWEKEVGKSLYNDPKHYINGHQFDQMQKNDPFTANYEFITKEGLRFSTSTGFS